MQGKKGFSAVGVLAGVEGYNEHDFIGIVYRVKEAEIAYTITPEGRVEGSQFRYVSAVKWVLSKPGIGVILKFAADSLSVLFLKGFELFDELVRLKYSILRQNVPAFL